MYFTYQYRVKLNLLVANNAAPRKLLHLSALLIPMLKTQTTTSRSQKEQRALLLAQMKWIRIQDYEKCNRNRVQVRSWATTHIPPLPMATKACKSARWTPITQIIRIRKLHSFQATETAIWWRRRISKSKIVFESRPD